MIPDITSVQNEDNFWFYVFNSSLASMVSRTVFAPFEWIKLVM